jgi:hypothetical protein
MRKAVVATLAVVIFAVGLLVYGPSSVETVSKYWNNEQLVNFWAAWIPFAISILLAFIPDQQMKPRTRIMWRVLVIVCGFLYSVLLWHQQTLTANSAQKILGDAVTESNAHSDQGIGEVRKDLQGVKTDIGGVKSELSETKDALAKMFSKSTLDITSSLAKVGKPAPEIAHVLFSLLPANLYSWPVLQQRLPIVKNADNTYIVNVKLSFMVKDHTAKGLRIWMRLGQQCSYGQEPRGFQAVRGHTVQSERLLTVGDFLANTQYEQIDIAVVTPSTYDGSIIELNYACDNCALVDADKPQRLTIWFDRSKPPS